MEFERSSCIRGYHIYKAVWQAAVREVLPCKREINNEKDRYAVAVMKDDTVIGHLPKKSSKICSLFVRRGGSIHCRVIGSRRYSVDLPQGGLEIPCILTFKSEPKEIQKLKKWFKK